MTMAFLLLTLVLLAIFGARTGEFGAGSDLALWPITPQLSKLATAGGLRNVINTVISNRHQRAVMWHSSRCPVQLERYGCERSQRIDRHLRHTSLCL